MSLRLVDSGWDHELRRAVQSDHGTIRIICPFITRRAAGRLLECGPPRTFEVITRFKIADFVGGVSDISALRLFLDAGARVRGVRGLHAKLFLIGAGHAIVTSANLTESGMLSNHEFGVVADDEDVVSACLRYFGRLWAKAGSDLTVEQLDRWENLVGAARLRGGRPSYLDGLPDEGADAGIGDATGSAADSSVADQAFVKIFGKSDSRAPRSLRILDEVARSGCHWACTYPNGKRPQKVRDGALMYMGRLVKSPDDIQIFGRAIGLRYVDGRDDASPAEIAERPWKAQWPHYVRVYNAEFIDGTLGDGVSLNVLMAELGSDAFASTRRNARDGHGNTNPRLAYRQQPAVELTDNAVTWVGERLEARFEAHGKLQPGTLEALDWPTVRE
jgi:hypothetical protein